MKAALFAVALTAACIGITMCGCASTPIHPEDMTQRQWERAYHQCIGACVATEGTEHHDSCIDYCQTVLID